METIVTAVTDEFPYYLRPKKASFSAVICIALFLMGLILTTEVRVWGWMRCGDQLGTHFRENLGQGPSLQRHMYSHHLRWKRETIDEPGLPGDVRSKGNDTALFLSLQQPQKESDVS